METIITDPQRMQTVLDEIPITSYRLTQELNLSSGAIYHILNGKNKLSKNMIDKICTLYPDVNKKYLLKGIGEPMLEINTNISNESQYVLIKKEDLDQVKKNLDQAKKDIQNLYEMLNKLIEI